MSDRTPFAPTGASEYLSDARTSRVCLYPGRPCFQPRDFKRNGDLHRFCRMHRQRHNEYQRASQERRRHRRLHRMIAQTPRPWVQIGWREAWEEIEPANDSVTDAELFSVLYELFVEPDVAGALPILYQQFEIDPLIDGPEDP